MRPLFFVALLCASAASAQAVKPFTCSNVRGCVANQPISPSQVNTPYANIGGLDAGPVLSTAVRTPFAELGAVDAGPINSTGISSTTVTSPYATLGGLDAGPVVSTGGKFAVLDAGTLYVAGQFQANLDAVFNNGIYTGWSVGVGGNGTVYSQGSTVPLSLLGGTSFAGANKALPVVLFGPGVGAQSGHVTGDGIFGGAGGFDGGSITIAGGGYARFDTPFVGAPTAGDCDDAGEQGRLAIDTTNKKLYVCFGTAGWYQATLAP